MTPAEHNLLLMTAKFSIAKAIEADNCELLLLDLRNAVAAVEAEQESRLFGPEGQNTNRATFRFVDIDHVQFFGDKDD